MLLFINVKTSHLRFYCVSHIIIIIKSLFPRFFPSCFLLYEADVRCYSSFIHDPLGSFLEVMAHCASFEVRFVKWSSFIRVFLAYDCQGMLGWKSTRHALLCFLVKKLCGNFSQASERKSRFCAIATGKTELRVAVRHVSRCERCPSSPRSGVFRLAVRHVPCCETCLMARRDAESGVGNALVVS